MTQCGVRPEFVSGDRTKAKQCVDVITYGVASACHFHELQAELTPTPIRIWRNISHYLNFDFHRKKALSSIVESAVSSIRPSHCASGAHGLPRKENMRSRCLSHVQGMLVPRSELSNWNNRQSQSTLTHMTIHHHRHPPHHCQRLMASSRR